MPYSDIYRIKQIYKIVWKILFLRIDKNEITCAEDVAIIQLEHTYAWIVLFLYFYSDPPSAPGKPEITDIDASSMAITWSVPTFDGGSLIKQYDVEIKSDRSNWKHQCSVSPQDIKTTTRIDGLKHGHVYQFRVLATNEAGIGVISEPSELARCKPPYGKLSYK